MDTSRSRSLHRRYSRIYRVAAASGEPQALAQRGGAVSERSLHRRYSRIYRVAAASGEPQALAQRGGAVAGAERPLHRRCYI